MFPETKLRETQGLSGRQNQPFPLGPFIDTTGHGRLNIICWRRTTVTITNQNKNKSKRKRPKQKDKRHQLKVYFKILKVKVLEHSKSAENWGKHCLWNKYCNELYHVATNCFVQRDRVTDIRNTSKDRKIESSTHVPHFSNNYIYAILSNSSSVLFQIRTPVSAGWRSMICTKALMKSACFKYS